MATKPKTARSNSKRTRRSYGAHIKQSLLFVAPHKHTGRHLHPRHSSHGLLLLLLLVTGFILFFSLASLEAAGITKNGQVNINFTVPGAAPTTGAVITSPDDQSRVTKQLLEVSGTCPSGTLVAVYNNAIFAGSTACGTESTFGIIIQMRLGINTIQAQNYDALNQPGPVTPQIHVAYEELSPAKTPQINTDDDITVDESIPTPTAPQPSQNPCYNPLPPAATSWVNVTVSCVIRNIFIGEKLDLPITITGGVAPYAASIDWGEGDSQQLFILSKDGRHVLSHVFSSSQVRQLSVQVTDAKGETTKLSTVVDVNDTTVPSSTAPNIIGSFFEPALVRWFESSVPIYWAAVALVMGFWIGDIFQRVFGIKKPIRRARA
jgi:hypothetical protein